MTQIQHPDPLWSSLRREVDDPRPPAALVLSIAFAAQLGWVALVDAASLSTGAAVVGIVIIAALASWWLTAPAALLSATLAFLVADGFVLGTKGDLSWNGLPDAALLVVIVLACLVSTGARREVARGRSTVNKP